MSTTTPAPSGKIIVQDNSAVSHLMDTGRFEHCYRIAKLMATASLIPDHLKYTGPANNKRELSAEERVGNCFMIVNQAVRWGIDPFSMAPETYVVGGKLAFQGKLVAAVVNGLANLEERLSYEFSGQPGSDDFTITVSGRIRGEDKPRTVQVRVGSVKTDNQMWKKDPEQKLVYTGATKWARRHCPEIILGILLDDEIEPEPMRNVTPPHIMPDQNPYEALPAAAAATEEKPPAKTRGKAKAKEEPAPEPAAETPAEPVEVIPSRTDMYKALKDACLHAEVSPATAEAKFRKAKLIPDGKTLADTTDEQLFAIYSARLTILPPKNAPADDPEADDGKDLMEEGGQDA